jgi:hypothetical protein
MIIDNNKYDLHVISNDCADQYQQFLKCKCVSEPGKPGKLYFQIANGIEYTLDNKAYSRVLWWPHLKRKHDRWSEVPDGFILEKSVYESQRVVRMRLHPGYFPEYKKYNRVLLETDSGYGFLKGVWYLLDLVEPIWPAYTYFRKVPTLAEWYSGISTNVTRKLRERFITKKYGWSIESYEVLGQGKGLSITVSCGDKYSVSMAQMIPVFPQIGACVAMNKKKMSSLRIIKLRRANVGQTIRITFNNGATVCIDCRSFVLAFDERAEKSTEGRLL